MPKTTDANYNNGNPVKGAAIQFCALNSFLVGQGGGLGKAPFETVGFNFLKANRAAEGKPTDDAAMDAEFVKMKTTTVAQKGHKLKVGCVAKGKAEGFGAAGDWTTSSGAVKLAATAGAVAVGIMYGM